MKTTKKAAMELQSFDSNKIQQVVNLLAASGNAFALFRDRFSKEIYLFLEQNGTATTRFMIHPFSGYDIAFISADILLENEGISVENLPQLFQKQKEENDLPFEMNQNEFENYVGEIVEICQTPKAEKVVAARSKHIQKTPNFNVGKTFSDLLENYPHAFISIWQHPEHGLWCGATPEVLIEKKSDTQFETMSLAGTKKIALQREWTSKEHEEQQIVTDTIKNVLENLAAKNIEISPAQTHEAGHIAHLKSNIQFESNQSIEKIALHLHPTPAVGGLPLQTALEFIATKEKNMRSCYAGYIGTANKLYVNLRCMQIFDKKIVLYVGAGITKDSNPKKEWLETETKAKTLLQFC